MIVDAGTAKGYLKFLASYQMAEAKKMGLDKPTPAQFILEHGKDYPLNFGPPMNGPPKYCYYNSYALASRSKGRFRYVEGWAVNIIATQHAWCVDKEGLIIETTWKEEGKSYYGVEIPNKVVKAVSLVTGVVGVFAAWWEWDRVLPLLKEIT